MIEGILGFIVGVGIMAAAYMVTTRGSFAYTCEECGRKYVFRAQFKIPDECSCGSKIKRKKLEYIE